MMENDALTSHLLNDWDYLENKEENAKFFFIIQVEPVKRGKRDFIKKEETKALAPTKNK